MKSRSFKEIFYPESRFGGFTDIDGTVVFYNRVNALLEPTDVVLDVGCGRGKYQDDPSPYRRNLQILQGRVQKVVGLDVDPAAATNPFLDEFYLLKGEKWPIASQSVNLTLCDWVLEHVQNPCSFFSEVRRVLKPGGHLCIRTTNGWGYLAFFARLVPNKFHAQATELVQDVRLARDVFPTIYKCNTVRKVKKMMAMNGLEGVVYPYEAEPSYSSFSKLAYGANVLYQRFAPRSIKISLFVFAKRIE